MAVASRTVEDASRQHCVTFSLSARANVAPRDITYPPVAGPGPPGAPVQARGPAGPGEHLGPGDAVRLP
jgi:hypothetical protein